MIAISRKPVDVGVLPALKTIEGAATMIKTLANNAPRVRKVESPVLSIGSDVITDANEP
ncbi:hypothetical protein D3C81_1731950 [compost metagenome]